MNIPGFTAISSLYKVNDVYQHSPIKFVENMIGDVVIPQISANNIAINSGNNGLNAWGCWEARCCVRGLCQDGPGGRSYWCCKSYEPCTRCIWPW